MPLHLCEATNATDLQQACALLQEVYVHGGFTTAERAAALMTPERLSPEGEFLVARKDGRIIGATLFLHAQSTLRQLAGADEREFRVLGVHPDARGSGAGEALVRACMDRARDAGATGLVLWTQPTMPAAHRLYERLGFQRIPDRDEHDPRGFQRLVYRLPVHPIVNAHYLLSGTTTQRLSFRPLRTEDFDTWSELFHEPGVAGFLGMDKTRSPHEHCANWFQKAYERYAQGTGGMNVMLDRTSGALIGQCGLLIQTVEGVESLEVGYSLHPQHWGRGYALEGARACKEHAFTQDLATSLISMINLDNIRSERVARRNGMRLQRTLADYKGMPANLFRIDRADWQKAR